VKEVYTFLELYVQYLRAYPNVSEQVDSQVLMKYTNEHVFLPIIEQMSMN